MYTVGLSTCGRKPISDALFAAYRAADGEMENEPQVLSKQISYFKNQYPSHYGGVAFFRYENLFKPSSAQKSKIQSELEALESQLE